MANIVKAKELGEYLKLSESTIYKLATDGKIPGFRIGKSWRFDLDEIVRLIQKEKRREPLRGNGSKVREGTPL
jgi:excisionase family DNA binding protein